MMRIMSDESVADACVDDDDELTHDGVDCDDLLFAVGDEAFVEGAQLRVVSACGQGGDEQDGPDLVASAAYPAIAVALAALVRVRGGGGERGACLAVVGAELGPVGDQGGG